MSQTLYTRLAEVCHLFYKLYFPHEKIATIIEQYLQTYHCKKIAFFGGCIYVADILQRKGYEITYIEYTPEMMARATKVLRGMQFVLSDMRTLALDEPQDAIILMGRILTYLHTDEDVQRTFRAFAANLKPSGILIMDNYETGKLHQGEYFNGTVEVGDAHNTIRRISTIKEISTRPSLHSWDCTYEHLHGGNQESYSDSGHVLRSFSQDEIEALLQASPLSFIEHAPNFEERSFITVARHGTLDPA